MGPLLAFSKLENSQEKKKTGGLFINYGARVVIIYLSREDKIKMGLSTTF